MTYIATDHLGSASLLLTSTSTVSVVAQTRYNPFGEVRWSNGATSTTDFGFTGQRTESGFGLMDYGARFYSSTLGRFISPDTIIPVAAQGNGAFDRYAYVNNNPIRFSDPSGHWICGDQYDPGCIENDDEFNAYMALRWKNGHTDYAYLVLRYKNGLDGAKPGSSDPNYVIPDMWDKDNVHVSAELISFVVDWEKFSLVAYQDQYEIWTIGFGHQVKKGEDFTGYTVLDFWNLFLRDIAENESYVRGAFQNLAACRRCKLSIKW